MKITELIRNIEKHYQTLNCIGNLGPQPEQGFFRPAYSELETEVMNYFEKAGTEIGLKARWDEYANLYLEKAGATSEFAEVGSHVDTVPSGGNFDGLAGIVAGFEAIKLILESEKNLKSGLRLRIWRGEESAVFKSAYLGSSAATGRLKAERLATLYNGISLKDHMLAQGANPDFLRTLKPSICQSELDSITLHLELHIEQGNTLEINKKDIGIVTSIRGPKRARVIITGEFNHSGATPMGVKYRRDANLAMAYMHVRLNESALSFQANNKDIIQTIGIINSDSSNPDNFLNVQQNGLTKVSGFAFFTLDIRSASDQVKTEFWQFAKKIIYDTAIEFNVSVKIEELDEAPAFENISKDTTSLLSFACDDFNLPYQLMPSGAGHDCAILGKAIKSNGSNIPIGLIFIPCREGISHSPKEWTSAKAIAQGALIMAKALTARAI